MCFVWPVLNSHFKIVQHTHTHSYALYKQTHTFTAWPCFVRSHHCVVHIDDVKFQFNGSAVQFESLCRENQNKNDSWQLQQSTHTYYIDQSIEYRIRHIWSSPSHRNSFKEKIFHLYLHRDVLFELKLYLSREIFDRRVSEKKTICAMGITGLLPFLEKASEKINIESLANRTIAIDSYCWWVLCDSRVRIKLNSKFGFSQVT